MNPPELDPCRITRVVAIDGPAGAGKSSAARMAARALGYAFLDTGAMYRAATWRAVHRGVDWDDAAAIARSTEAMKLELSDRPEGLAVRVDGTDVTEAIRTPEITRLISRLDNIPDVRNCLVELQRAYGAKRPTVAEGRDMGTVVFPAALCKLYLDASIDERVQRRASEMTAKGIAFDELQLATEIRERDERDMTRTIAPLRRAPDAVVLDTTSKSLAEVVADIVRLAHERIGA